MDVFFYCEAMGLPLLALSFIRCEAMGLPLLALSFVRFEAMGLPLLALSFVRFEAMGLPLSAFRFYSITTRRYFCVPRPLCSAASRMCVPLRLSMRSIRCTLPGSVEL